MYLLNTQPYSSGSGAGPSSSFHPSRISDVRFGGALGNLGAPLAVSSYSRCSRRSGSLSDKGPEPQVSHWDDEDEREEVWATNPLLVGIPREAGDEDGAVPIFFPKQVGGDTGTSESSTGRFDGFSEDTGSSDVEVVMLKRSE